MKKSNISCLNNKIKEYMSNNQRNVERLDSIGIKSMLYELNNEELCLLTFSALADVYVAPYKFTIKVNDKKKVLEKIITSEDDYILWYEIDKIYKEFTGKMLYSSTMTFRELEEAFDKINGEILFE